MVHPRDLWPVWPEAATPALVRPERDTKDILDGLAVLLESPLIKDIRDTFVAFPGSSLPIALNKKQTACKKWAVEQLLAVTGGRIQRVVILAGWYGVLAAMLLHDRRFSIGEVTVVDIDSGCREVALSLNATSVRNGRFRFVEADIMDLDYAALALGRDDVLVNTSCEHLPAFGAWVRAAPAAPLLVLQSNDYDAIPEHVSVMASLEAFREAAGLRDVRFADTLELDSYRRFMLIGRK